MPPTGPARRTRALGAAGQACQRHQRDDADASDDDTVEDDAAAPADGHDAEPHGRRDNHLAHIADEIVDAERGAAGRGGIDLRDQRRGDRVLDRRADAGQQNEGTQRGIALGRRQQCEGDAGKHGAGRQQRALADPLGQHAGRQLQKRHGGGVGHAQGADLHVAEAEGLRPDGQQHVEGVGNAVVHEVRGAGGRERAALGAHALRDGCLVLVLADAQATCRPCRLRRPL